ncbi:MAG: hypothetical protein ACRDPE_11355 [Solirubrobacterales bacterium]
MRREKIAAALIGALVLLTGCGGSSGSTLGSSARSQPSAEFLGPDSKDNVQIVGFGAEAPSGERDAASAVLALNLNAREAADFAAQCATLSQRVVIEIENPASKETLSDDCATGLERLARPLSSTKNVRKNRLRAAIAALRIKGDKGYALFHGNDGRNYAMLMEKEGGQWKVGSLLTKELSEPPPRGTRHSSLPPGNRAGG